jgi:Rrf2 family iron-sulfur cluster assembly transcriptional regulator
MILQRSSELAIRAAFFLSHQAPGKLSPAHEIAAHAGVSEPYLAKILQRLSAAGLIQSFRGPGRGMKLARPANTITLASLVLVMEGSNKTNACVLGLPACSNEVPCALHHEWVPIRASICNLLEKTTLADLAKSITAQEAIFKRGKAMRLPVPAKVQAGQRRRRS